MSELRTPLRRIPNYPSLCPFKRCVYNDGGYCDDPRTNKGNSDAECHRMSNRKIIEYLENTRSNNSIDV
jgi:hypothetical protein